MSFPPPASSSETRLRLRGITKTYPSCMANSGIDLDVRAGEIHALLGENGAGKSTLVKIAYGLVKPDAGEIVWEGRPVRISNPAEARQLGIGMVFQHFSLFESLSVCENIALGMPPGQRLERLSEHIRKMSVDYGLRLDPSRRVHDLTVGERQRVEIVRCLLQAPRLLVMDEPTSVLTPRAVQQLFDTLRRLAAEGCSILYISHKLDEIRTLCERATVLRAGRVVARCDPRRETPHSLATMMIGSDLPAFQRPPANSIGAARLTVHRLSVDPRDPFGTRLESIDLELRAGEILGIAGVAGNGQRELLAALSGERLASEAGGIRIDNTPVGHLGPAARREQGLSYVPEERLGRASVPDMSLVDNVLLSSREGQFDHWGFVRRGALKLFAESVRRRFKVISNGISAPARSLSGGNLQKFVVGREILQQPKILIVAQPTWGVDVGAAAIVHRALLDLRASGGAILLVSEDLDELFQLCDRVAVISGGRLSPPRRTAETDAEEIGLWMGGMDSSPVTRP